MGAAAGGMTATPTDTRRIIRPRALRPGDTVGLITPSTYVTDPDRLELVRRTIAHLGLKANVGRERRQA